MGLVNKDTKIQISGYDKNMVTGMINWPYIKELTYTFDPSGTFTEDCTFSGNVSYWREDRFKPPIPVYDNGLPTIKWEAPQDE